ncbi:MAG: hypothetical protein DRP60_11810, partial [Spirochaetes bacterium]
MMLLVSLRFFVNLPRFFIDICRQLCRYTNMVFDKFIDLTSSIPYFDMAAVVQLTDDSRRTITNQLYRWSEAGKIIQLRQGMYTLADRYRQVTLSPAALANNLYRPSYLSSHW